MSFSSSIFNEFGGANFPTTYLVVDMAEDPKNIVPFNLLYLFGDLMLKKQNVRPSYLPFSREGQRIIAETVRQKGYCFYKWPGKILGETLGDVLEIDKN